MKGRLLDYILSQPLLCTPEAAEVAASIAARESADAPESVSGRKGHPVEGSESGMTRRDGVAVIPVCGPISRYATLMHDLCGEGATVERVARDLQAAVDSPSVRAILLNVDSPGGEANGVSELAAMVRAAGGTKPVCAYVGGQGCSAAYWIASAASEVVCSDSAVLGSIGTVWMQKKRSPKAGEKEWECVSTQSPLKRPDFETEAGRQEVQRVVDDMTAVFVNAVAGYRGTTPESVTSDFGRGGVMVGRKAVDAGMADDCGDFESCLSRLARGEKAARPMPKPTKPAAKAGAKPRRAPVNYFQKLFSAVAKADPEAAAAAIAESDESFDAAEFLSSVKTFAPAVPDADALRAEVEARVKAELKAAADAEFRTFYAEQASAAFDAFVKADKAVPAEKDRFAALYVDAAMADRSGPLSLADGSTFSRVSYLTGNFETRADSGRLVTHVKPNAKPGEVAERLKGKLVLPEAHGDAAEEARAKSDRRVAEMLAAVGATPAQSE